MQCPSRSCPPVEQATSPASVFRIMLENFRVTHGFEHFIEADSLLDHLLVSVLGEPKFTRICLRFDPLK